MAWNDEPPKPEELNTSWNSTPPTQAELHGDPGMISSGLEWLNARTAAPTRASLMAIEQGKNPLSAFGQQYGKPSETAPSGKDIMAGLGVSTSPVISGTPQSISESVIRSMGLNPIDMTKLGVNLGNQTSANKPLPSPAELSGNLLEMEADPLNMVGPLIGSVAKGPLRGAAQTIKEGKAAETARLAEKINSPEIRKAAAELGVQVVPGQIYDSKFLQDLESLLQQSPSPIGRARGAKAAEAFKNVSAQVSNALPGTDLSAFDVGEKLRGGLGNAISSELTPVQKLYENIKESTQNIPIAERSKQAISRNIGKIPEAKFTSSGVDQLIANAAADVGKLETVDDVKQLNTLINRSLPPTASGTQRSVVGQISKKLKALEEGTIVRQAEKLATETKDPKMQALVTGLVDERKAANSQYRDLIDKLSTLSEGLGKKRIKSPSDAQNFIENLQSEKLAKNLFQKNNVEFMNFVSDKFPDQAKEVFSLERQRIKDVASQGKNGFNPNSAIKEVNKLPKEIRSKVFNEEQLGKFRNAEAYLKSLPDNINPSRTSIADDIKSWFEGPLKNAQMTARDAAVLAMLKSGGTLSTIDVNKIIKNAGSSGGRGLNLASKAYRLKSLEGK